MAPVCICVSLAKCARMVMEICAGWGTGWGGRNGCFQASDLWKRKYGILKNQNSYRWWWHKLGKSQCRGGQPGPNYAELYRACAGPQTLGASCILLAASFQKCHLCLRPHFLYLMAFVWPILNCLLRQPWFCWGRRCAQLEKLHFPASLIDRDMHN